MTDLDDRIRAALIALAPEPTRSGAHVVAKARRSRARDRYGLAAAIATVTALAGASVAATTTRDSGRHTQILDTDVSTTTSTTTTTTIEPTVVGPIPQLVPLTTDAAVQAIADAGFVPDARPVDVPAGDASAGRVITQTPAAGSNATKGTTIQFTYGRPTN